MQEQKFHDDLTLEKFHLEWFGPYGRELGSDEPHQFGSNPDGHEKSRRMFCDDPKVYLQFMDWCKANRHACWITSQPMRAYNMPFGIEKVFFDFDYHLEKNENMTPSKRSKVQRQFSEFLESLDFEPFIASTRKGFHAYVFLRRIYEFDPINVEFAKEVFGVLGLTLLGIRDDITKLPKLYCELIDDDRAKWKYLDFGPLGDIMRHARVPLTVHEVSGVPCQVLNRSLEPTKIRSLDLYRAYGMREDVVRDAVEAVKEYHKRKLLEEWKRTQSGANEFEPEDNGRFHGQIRPCFSERLRLGVMQHNQRLALLPEAYFSLLTEKERKDKFIAEAKLMEICHQFKDYDERKSRTQVLFFLKQSKHFPPWRCSTIQRWGWCLKSECSMYRPKMT